MHGAYQVFRVRHYYLLQSGLESYLWVDGRQWLNSALSRDCNGVQGQSLSC